MSRSVKDSRGNPLRWFEDMIDHCYDYATRAKARGHPIVGIMCEYTPRELIMAAGGVPVCLCGGSVARIASAEQHLPANLCPLIKSTFGYHIEKANPFLEMADLIVAETTCDGKKKMFELMARSRPMHVLELPQKVNDPDAFAHWVKELHKLKKVLEQRFGVSITNAKIRRVIGVMNRERQLRRELGALMQREPPPLTGRRLLDLKSIISGIPSDLTQYGRILKHLRSQRPDRRLGSRVRVLLTGVPVVHGAERVVDIIEKHGGLVVCAENCTGLRPILDDVETDSRDPIRALARKYFHIPCSVMTPNTRRFELIRRLAAEYRVQCVVDLIWQACLTYDVESSQIKRLAEEELRLPFLRIETDYSPSDSSRIALRLEALFETVRG
jgi:benzoyl-CoA reductase/2-hydroxyglutaryl-CoA dehydratase subunit BcrC/BadD/HgdB